MNNRIIEYPQRIFISFLRAIFLSSIGIRFLKAFISIFRLELMNFWREDQVIPARFSDIQLPKDITGFEDLYFLFWCSPLNRGLVRLDFDEAAYVFKLVKSLKNPFCVEIGRFRGGSTFLIASAMNQGRLISLDLHIYLEEQGKVYDVELSNALNKFGWKDKVDLIVADARAYENANFLVDFLFIDGDHTYEGVKKDFERWSPVVKVDGHILFHDACATHPYAGMVPEVNRFINELQGKDNFVKVKEMGSLIHFVKREV